MGRGYASDCGESNGLVRAIGTGGEKVDDSRCNGFDAIGGKKELVEGPAIIEGISGSDIALILEPAGEAGGSNREQAKS